MHKRDTEMERYHLYVCVLGWGEKFIFHFLALFDAQWVIGLILRSRTATRTPTRRRRLLHGQTSAAKVVSCATQGSARLKVMGTYRMTTLRTNQTCLKLWYRPLWTWLYRRKLWIPPQEDRTILPFVLLSANPVHVCRRNYKIYGKLLTFVEQKSFALLDHFILA